jgi:hypothetical protein
MILWNMPLENLYIPSPTCLTHERRVPAYTIRLALVRQYGKEESAEPAYQEENSKLNREPGMDDRV